MKLLPKIIFTILVISAVIFSLAYIFLRLNGRTIIVKQLEELTQKKVSLDYFHINPPIDIEVKNLTIAGLAKIESLYISPNIFGLLIGQIAFNKVQIIKPEITYERAATNTSDLPGVASKLKESARSKKKILQHLVFKTLNIKDGRIDLIDRTVGENGIKLILKDINFTLNNAYVFPSSIISNFDLKSKIPWNEAQKEGSVEAEGWINLFKKDMQANLKVSDIDGIYLYPYYSQWVKLEKTGIEKANLNFTSNIHSLNNNLTAECHIELTDMVRKQPSTDESEKKAAKITNVVLEMFRALNQGKIVLDFTIRTKMDNPQFGFGDIRAAVEDKIMEGKRASGLKPADVLQLPTSLLKGIFKGATDLTSAVISGVGSVGKELKDTAEVTFRRERQQ